MYLLDTNVVSELRKARRQRADLNVVAWALGVSDAEKYVSVTVIQELETGALQIARRDPPVGDILRQWVDQVIKAFAGRIHVVDLAVARRCAALHVPDPRSDRDALIAATALVHDLTVVTRNVVDFSSIGVRIINPWLAPAP